jgi:hypothetical protein
VVDDQVGRDERVELLRVPAAPGHRVPQGGEVDDRGHAGEVLHQHPGGGEADLPVAVPAGMVAPAGPARQGAQPVDLVAVVTDLERAACVEPGHVVTSGETTSRTVAS